ncbi:MAG: DUF4230 domain-containing protein [Lachnospiraceae bacterium]|nr:DUF4230 domain-containing protein [Lachnospiraceae bacterium]
MASDHKNNKNEGKPNWLEQTLSNVTYRIIILLILFATVVLVVAGYRLANRKRGNVSLQTVQDIVHGEEGKVSTITQASLVKIVTTGKLYTAEYPYNGIAAVYDGDTLKYHVAYEGTVKAGIDTSKILLHLDEKQKEIIIRLPAVEITEPIVNVGTLDFIFEKGYYETETVGQEAYKAAINDLKSRVAADSDIASSAARSAKMYEKAFVQPLIEQMDPDTKYTIVVLEQGEEYK